MEAFVAQRFVSSKISFYAHSRKNFDFEYSSDFNYINVYQIIFLIHLQILEIDRQHTDLVFGLIFTSKRPLKVYKTAETLVPKLPNWRVQSTCGMDNSFLTY